MCTLLGYQFFSLHPIKTFLSKFTLLTVSMNCHAVLLLRVLQQRFCGFESVRDGKISIEMYIKYAGIGGILLFLFLLIIQIPF